jgi:cytochrome c553
MLKLTRDTKKTKSRIGRPRTTGAGQPQVVRMHDQQIAEIDAWIAAQGTVISRPEAIRRLVGLGLKPRK